MAKATGMFAGVSRLKQGAKLAPRTRERFAMKRSWGWILAAIAVVCLLWSLGLQASMNPASLEKHSVAWPRESHSPLSCPSLRVRSGSLIRGRAGPQEFFFSHDVLLRAEDLDPAVPLWLDLRGPPGRYRDPGRPVGLSVAKVATAALTERGKLRLHPELSAGRPPEI
jgi:hypothetical protein